MTTTVPGTVPGTGTGTVFFLLLKKININTIKKNDLVTLWFLSISCKGKGIDQLLLNSQ
jgi:hypothetical protein